MSPRRSPMVERWTDDTRYAFGHTAPLCLPPRVRAGLLPSSENDIGLPLSVSGEEVKDRVDVEEGLHADVERGHGVDRGERCSKSSQVNRALLKVGFNDVPLEKARWTGMMVSRCRWSVQMEYLHVSAQQLPRGSKALVPVTVSFEKQEHALTDASVSRSMTAGAATSLSS